MIRDDFDRPVPAGAVIGSVAGDGTERRGTDAEGVLAVDNGALRIGFMRRPGWGREVVSYPPQDRREGLAMSVLALNGHNASQVWRPRVRHRERPAWLWRLLTQGAGPDHLDQNFAVGWVAGDPDRSRPRGSLLMVNPVIGENADLAATILGEPVSVLGPLHNVPIVYVVVLRERGAIYYAASLAGVRGLPPLPLIRPLAIDPGDGPGRMVPTIEQSILAETGWRVDSRVAAVRVGDTPGPLGSGLPVPSSGEASDLSEACGLLYARVDGGGEGIRLRWRGSAGGDGAVLALSPAGLTLTAVRGGVETTVAADPELHAGGEVHLQVLDDGTEVTVLVGSEIAFGGALRDPALPDGTWIETVAGSGADIFEVEAHPRTVELPAALRPPPPWDERGGEEILVDRFEGAAGELGAPWVRRVGSGRFLVDADGARVDADLAHPNPGRLVYTRPWGDPEFAEISIDQTPPGRREGEGEQGRGGLVLMQDTENYLVVSVWLDEVFPGTSISSFLVLDGEEDLYDAVWCNIGRRVRWGAASRLTLASDGMNWTLRVDDVPVLQRALTDVYPDARRLRIAEVGICANWEFGDDTGTQVHEFRARKGRR